MKDSNFAIRLHEARLAMKLSMDKLVKLAGGAVTKQSISRYEKGIMHPKRDALQALAKALNISEGYFKGTSVHIDMPMLRTSANSKLTDEQLAHIEARLSFWAEQYLNKEKEAGFHTSFENPIAGTVVSSKKEAMQAANLLRKRWNCGESTIPSILRLLERKGIKILSAELPDGILGLSTWADAKHPIIVLDLQPNKDSIERLRFTTAHELAHLLLTIPKHDADGNEINLEKICNLFAPFFLLPKSTYIEEMGSEKREAITLEEMIDIKEQYGLSLQALIIEARDYGIIETDYKRWWYAQYIEPNPKEIGLGNYPFPETIGKEKRINSIINHKNENYKHNNNF